MKSPSSRFGNLSAAMRDSAAQIDAAATPPQPPAQHRPTMAMARAAESLTERLARAEAEKAELGAAHRAEIARLKALAENAGASASEFLFLDPGLLRDTLPRDRLPGAFDGAEFQALLEDIRLNGQNDAITVRRLPDGGYDIAAGRRRLEVCRRLGIAVLARCRDLDDAAMLRVQFSENERREDISALERARWFSEVRTRMKLQGRELAAQFGLDPSTFSLYLRLARFPTDIIDRLRAPRKLAMLRARRVMEAVEADPDALPRILAALDSQLEAVQGDTASLDADDQIAVLMRAAEGRGRAPAVGAAPAERRHIVHEGRRIGTLTRNGGQWVFRFATALPDAVVHRLADQLPSLLTQEQPTTES